MRKLGVLALLAAALGCEDLPPDRTAEHADVRRAFDAWVKTMMKGDAPASWAGLLSTTASTSIPCSSSSPS